MVKTSETSPTHFFFSPSCVGKWFNSQCFDCSAMPPAVQKLKAAGCSINGLIGGVLLLHVLLSEELKNKHACVFLCILSVCD